MKPMYVLMDGDDFILPRLQDRFLVSSDWNDSDISNMHIDGGREFTQIRYRFDTLKEVKAFKRKLEVIRKAIIKHYKDTIKRYPHMESIYDQYLVHHQHIKTKIVQVTFTDC